MDANKPYMLATNILIKTLCIDHWVRTVAYGVRWSLAGNCYMNA